MNVIDDRERGSAGQAQGVGMKKGWEIMSLGELCDVLDHKRKPITKRDREAGEYPYYGATGVLDKVAGYLFDEPLVLVGEDGAKWGSGENTAFAVEGKIWVNNHAHVLRPYRLQLLDGWLIYHLNHSDLSAFVSGLTVPKLNQGSLREIPIPVPPLPEQQRIVVLLDEAFAGLATAKANAERNLQNGRALFESHLQAVFSQRGEGWVEKALESCCEQIFAGGDVPKDRLSKVRTAQYSVPIYSNGEKDDGLYGFTDIARVTTPSVTVSARGTLGFSAIRSEPFLPVVRLIVLVPDLEQISLPFLYYAVVGMDFGNTGTSIPQLTVPNIKESKLHVPPLSEQIAIVEKLDALSEETQRLTRIYERKLAALDELKKSLLHQAFNGEL
jgi:type I restriction enzyme S subunit